MFSATGKKLTWALLVAAFLGYSILLYLPPTPDTLSPLEVSGRLVWQRHNCQACHQLYGLGGYLGPDLTNVWSAAGKGPALIRAKLLSGSGVMPAFHLNEDETESLLAYLKAMDASGQSDPRLFRTHLNGNISLRHED